MHTIIDLITDVSQKLDQAQVHFGHGTDNSWDEAVWMVWHVLGIQWGESVDEHRHVETDYAKRIYDLLRLRIEQRTPLAYLTGTAWLCGVPFAVNPDVLIPRSPIGEFITGGLSPWFADRVPRRILDLCCGSGCLGILCALVFDGCKVDLVDISQKALTVAEMNIARHDLQANVRCLQSDLFESVTDKYDFILTNPPYVSNVIMPTLPPEYQHEPQLGLAGGDDGLRLVETILAGAGDYLADDGLLVVEVGDSEQEFSRKHPEFNVTWLDFERGGHGVFAIEKDELLL